MKSVLSEFKEKILPHLLIVLGFILVTYIYFPDLLEGKNLKQGDIVQHRGADKSRSEHVEKYNEEPLWADNLFSGMPTAFIGESTGFANLTQLIPYTLNKVIRYPFVGFIIAMICFYYLLYSMGVRSWLAALGAFAYAFATYNIIIIEAGHNTKFMTIAYSPLVLAGFLQVFQKNKPWLGAGVFGVGLSLNLASKHPQVTYYLAITLFILGIFYLIKYVKEKQVKQLIINVSLLFVVAGLALLSNADRLWSQYEHAKYSIRGEQILTPNSNEEIAGMTKDYITSWSYGKMETLNLLIPNLKGGGSVAELSSQSETYELIKKAKGERVARQMIKQMPTYWGDQPFTSGPMYIGALTIFLFVLGLLFVKGPLKWGVVTVIALTVMLAWGRHFMWLTDLFIDYVPFYNKFRVPSTLLIIPMLLMPLLGMLGLQTLLNNKEGHKVEQIKNIKLALSIIGGICLLFFILPDIAGDFISRQDANVGALADTLPMDRKSMLRSDAFRSFALVALASLLLWFWIKNKIATKYVIIGVGVLMIFDLWGVDKRYLNTDHFYTQKEVKTPFAKRNVDNLVLQDKSPNYRVLDLSINTFNSNQCSYYHKAIGGYSAAKLRRYQDVIEHHISPEISLFAQKLGTVKGQVDLDKLLGQLKVINLLNTKYIILNSDSNPLVNTSALGHAWFVKKHQMVSNNDDEIAQLGHVNPAETAIIHEEFASLMKAYQYDSLANIQLTDYRANKLTYSYQSKTDQLVVFSEVYYPYGWYASIDGEPVEAFRTNYITRGMIVPAGEHTIEWYFRPEAFDKGIMISYVASALLLLFFIGVIWFERKKKIAVEK